MSGDVNVREFLLEPKWAHPYLGLIDAKPASRYEAWDAPPGIYVEESDRHDRRFLLVWGDAQNRTLVVPARFDDQQVLCPSDGYRSIRQQFPHTGSSPATSLIFLWPLETTDRLPKPFGPCVADYIARLEAGKGETE